MLVQVYPPNPLAAVVAHIPNKETSDRIFCSYFVVESGGRILLAVQHPCADYHNRLPQAGVVSHIFPFRPFEVDLR